MGGVIVPIVTPFTPDGQVDRDGVKRIVKHEIENGIHGLFLVGTMGEGLSMSFEQRVTMVGAVADAVGSAKMALYASVSGNCLSESVQMSKRFADVSGGKLSAVVAHAPFYFPVTEKELDRYLNLLADQVSVPLLAYNISATTKVTISIDTVKRLMKHPRVMGIKDSDRDVKRLDELLGAVAEGGREGFQVVIGNGLLATEGVKRGGTGVVVSGGNLEPALWVKWWNAAMDARGGSGSWEKVQQLQSELDAITNGYMAGRTLGGGIAMLKAFMSKRGLCGPAVLPPLMAAEVQ